MVGNKDKEVERGVKASKKARTKMQVGSRFVQNGMI